MNGRRMRIACLLFIGACGNAKVVDCDPGSHVEPIVLRELGQSRISGAEIGMSNIEAGGRAARLDISGPRTGDARILTVQAGSIVSIGDDRYCVTSIASGRPGHGSLKLLPQ